MPAHSLLPCPVCHRHGIEFDESDKDGRIWSVCHGPHDAVTEVVYPNGSRHDVNIPDTLIFTHDIRNLLQPNGRLMSHHINKREWLIRIVVDGTVFTLQSKPGLAEEK